MKEITKIVGFIAIVLIPFLGQSQQDPQYSQYTYAMGLINPAYVSTTDAFSITSLARRQWTGVQGAPETLTFTAGLPIFSNNGGLALSIINDNIGPVSETNVFADISYNVQVSSDYNLAFGMRTGLTLLNVSDINFSDDNFDPLDVPINYTSPSLGFGLFLYSNNFYAGVSIPNFLESKYLENQNGFVSTSSEVKHIFASAGYVIVLNDQLKLKPSAMVKLGSGGNNSTDISANMFMQDKVEVGLSYRIDVDNSFQGESITAMLAFNVGKEFRIGYAFDYTLSQFQDFNSGTHEIMVGYRFNRETKVTSPRIF